MPQPLPSRPLPSRPGPAARSRQGGALLSIQYLRGIAALGVILFHQVHFLPLMAHGHYGVDLFFVISGFIMIHISDRRPVSPGRFWSDRILRIVPLYWTITLIAVLMTGLGLPFYAADTDPLRLLQSLLFIPHENAAGRVWPTLFLGWTLNYEMFFYLLFGLALALPARWRLPALAAAFLALTGAGALLRPEGAIARTYTDPRMLEFLLGAVLGRIYGRLAADPAAPLRQGLALLAAALGLAAIWPSLGVGLACGLILALGLWIEARGWLPRIGWLKTLGDASFSIYIFQQFWFEIATLMLAIPTRLTGLSFDQGMPKRLCCIALAVLGGIAVYRWIERPMHEGLRRRLIPRGAPAPNI